MSQPSKHVYTFGDFRLDGARISLIHQDQPVPLSPKLFDTLLLLVENPGRVVEKDEFIKRVWPDTFVGDETLARNIYVLRKLLAETANGQEYILTVPKRGYRFVGEVKDVGEELSRTISAAVARQPNVAVSASAENLQLPPLRQNARAEQSGEPESQVGVRQSWKRWAVVALAAVVAAALGGHYNILQRDRKASASDNPHVIQEYEQGRELWRQRTPETLAKAIAHFNNAVALDRSYAPAYSGLADAYVVLPLLSTVSQEEAYTKARDAAAKALALDPLLAEAHTSAADVELYTDWDFAAAEREFHRAIELNPNYATAHQWYAEYLSLMGRHEEAIEEIQRAQKLEPLSVIMYHQAGQIFQNARQYDKAIVQYDRALEISPGFTPSAARLGDALRHKGMYRDALETELKFFGRGDAFYDPGGTAVVALKKRGHAYDIRGEAGYWRARLEENQRGPITIRVSYRTAVVYAQLGDSNNAFLCLEKAYEGRYVDVLSLKVDPDLDPLRADPRFQDLIRRVGLPQ